MRYAMPFSYMTSQRTYQFINTFIEYELKLKLFIPRGQMPKDEISLQINIKIKGK